MKKFLIMVPLFLAACTVNLDSLSMKGVVTGVSTTEASPCALTSPNTVVTPPDITTQKQIVEENLDPTPAPIPNPSPTSTPCLKGDEIRLSGLSVKVIGLRPWQKAAIHFLLNNTCDKTIYYHFTINFYQHGEVVETRRMIDSSQKLIPSDSMSFDYSATKSSDYALVTIDELRLEPFPVPSQPVSP